jgi:hypothetical protein
MSRIVSGLSDISGRRVGVDAWGPNGCHLPKSSPEWASISRRLRIVESASFSGFLICSRDEHTAQRIGGLLSGDERIPRCEVVGIDLDFRRCDATSAPKGAKERCEVSDAGSGQQAMMHHLAGKIQGGRRGDISDLDGQNGGPWYFWREDAGVGTSKMVPCVDHHPAVCPLGAPCYLIGSPDIGYA